MKSREGAIQRARTVSQRQGPNGVYRTLVLDLLGRFTAFRLLGLPVVSATGWHDSRGHLAPRALAGFSLWLCLVALVLRQWHELDVFGVAFLQRL